MYVIGVEFPVPFIHVVKQTCIIKASSCIAFGVPLYMSNAFIPNFRNNSSEGFPSHFFIDPNGVITQITVGEMDYWGLDSQVKGDLGLP